MPGLVKGQKDVGISVRPERPAMKSRRREEAGKSRMGVKVPDAQAGQNGSLAVGTHSIGEPEAEIERQRAV